MNEINNNTGLYTTCGALLGGCAGAGTNYIVKPWLKKGMPTDSFSKEIESKHQSYWSEKLKKVDSITDQRSFEELIGVDVLKQYPDEFVKSGGSAAEYKEAAGSIINNRINMNGDSLYLHKQDLNSISKSELDAVKKAERKVSSKSALLLGLAGALLFGAAGFALSDKK